MALPQVGVEAVVANLNNFKRSSKTVTKSFIEMDESVNMVSGSTVKSGNKLTALGGSLLKLGGIAAGLAVGGLATLTAALTSFAVGGIKAASNLEQQIANIGAVMGKTVAETQPLKELIQDLSLNPKLKVDTTEAANAIELLARNGLSMTQILDGAALQTVALANATGTDFGQAADIATDVLAIFNIAVEDMGQAVDGVAGVMTNSKFTANDYAQALANAGAIASASGVGLDDFNTVIAATSSFFKSGSDAGTSFKTALQRLANPTEEAAALMEELGIDVFDSNGAMRSMGEISGQLQTALAGMSEEQRASTAAILGGADASRTLLGLSRLSEEQFNALSAEVNRTGAAMDASATRMNTLQGALEILKGIFEAVQIQVGERFIPILTILTKNLTAVAEDAAPKVLAFFDNLILGITQAVAVLQAGTLEESIMVIGNTITSTFETVIQPALQTWADRFWDWITVAIANLPASLTMLTNAITDFITNEAAIIQDSTQAWQEAIFAWVSEAAAQVGNFMGVLIVAIAAWVSSDEGQGAMLALGESLGEFMAQGIANMFNDTGQTSALMSQLIAGLLAAAVAAIGLIIAIGAQIAAGILEGLINELTGSNFEAATIGELRTILTNISRDMLTIARFVGTNIVEGLVAGIASLQQSVNDALMGLVTAAITTLKSFLGISSPSTVFFGFGSDIIQGLIDGIRSLASSLPGVIASIGSSIAGAGSDLVSGLFGSDDAAAPSQTISFDASGLLELQTVQALVDSIKAGLGAIATTSLPSLSTAILVFVESFSLQFGLVNAAVALMDTGLMNIALITLPQLLAQAQVTTQIMLTGFQSVINIVNVAIGRLVQMAAEFATLAAAAESSAKKIEEAFKTVTSTFNKATGSIKKLKNTVLNLVKAYQKLEAAAKAAARAARSVAGAAGAAGLSGSSASQGLGLAQGIGFQNGTLGLGLGFKVPNGFPNDSFPMRVESGEEVMVTPRGQTIEGVIAQRLGQLISRPGRVEGPGTVINNTTINNVTNNQFDMAVETGASAPAVVQQFEVARSLIG